MMKVSETRNLSIISSLHQFIRKHNKMAGQKLYSTNFLTSTKNAVMCSAAYSVDTSKTAAQNGSTLQFGKYVLITNNLGVLTVTFPEKFARCEYVEAKIADPSKTGNTLVLTTDYNPANGTAVFSLLSPSQAAISTGVYKVYVQAVFSLG